MAVKLKVKKREEIGKNKVKKLRLTGVVPGVVYGAKHAPMAVSVNLRELNHLFKGEKGKNTIIDLEIEGHDASLQVLSHRNAINPISQLIEHVDFLIVDGKAVSTLVPVVLNGTAAGVKLGGVLVQHLYEVRISCEASAIPVRIDVDITQLGPGANIKVADLAGQYPQISFVTPANEIIAFVDAARLAKAADPKDGASSKK